MKNFIIVGAGGFAREVFHWLEDWIAFDDSRRSEYQIKGFLSLDKNELDDFQMPVGILGDENSYDHGPDDLFVMGIGQTAAKRKVANRLIDKNVEFFTLIHPTAIVCSTSKIGKGVVICPFCSVSSHIQIGDFAMLNCHTAIGHDCVIGDFCVLSGFANMNGFAKLEDEVFLGTRATIVASKTVGFQSRVSAHALVVSNVPERTTVLANAGKMIPNLN